MRIPAAWWWVPAAVTFSGMVYLSMVKLSVYQAAQREPAVIREAPKPFTPPPPQPRREPSLLEEPPAAEFAPAGQPPAALPFVTLPPFHTSKTK
ncbi:MAG: hypothetical protein ABUS49_07285 [Acidobacteriota bacterium]